MGSGGSTLNGVPRTTSFDSPGSSRHTLWLRALCEWKKRNRNPDLVRTVRCQRGVESTQRHARSDKGAGDLRRGYPDDARSERNLSQGGMQVEVDDLKTKDAVQLTFRLPVSGVVVDAVGAVVWGSERRRGIRFTSMGKQSQQTIRQFMAEQTERHSKM